MEPEAVTLDFHGKKVRTYIEGGKAWWCSIDVCGILGYANSRDALAQHCKIDSVAKRYAIDSLGRKHEVSFINESNLYRLIMRSMRLDAVSSLDEDENYQLDTNIINPEVGGKVTIIISESGMCKLISRNRFVYDD